MSRCACRRRSTVVRLIIYLFVLLFVTGLLFVAVVLASIALALGIGS